MNIYRITIIVITLSVELSCLACNPERLPHMLRQLETGKNRKIDRIQTQTLTILIQKPQLSADLITCALDILLFAHAPAVPRFPELQSHTASIDDALSLFDYMPGFKELLIHVIAEFCEILPQTDRWYEISAANWIEHSQPDESVVAFGKPVDYDASLPRTLLHNIITNKRWIECKTIKWAKLAIESGKKKKNLRRQLLRQQELVTRYNLARERILPYELFCKYPITHDWHDWLAEHMIRYQVVPEEP